MYNLKPIIALLVVWSAIWLVGCQGCSRSGQIASNHVQPVESPQTQAEDREVQKEVVEATPAPPTVLRMEKKGGVYQVSIKVNDQQLFAIFDTGAASVSLSMLEAQLLHKNGLLTNDDVTGTQQFMDASGNITEGMVVNLRSVKIGEREFYNVKASITSNPRAPILLGQSILERFNRFSVDYSKNEIVLE